MELSPTAASKAADAVTALLAGGTLRLYDSSRMELAALRFASPAFAKSVDGIAIAEPLESGRSRASGAPVRFRAFDTQGREVIAGSVGRSGADLTVPVDLIVAGAEVLLVDLTYTHPRQ